MKKYILGSMAAALLMLGGCQDSYEAPGLNVPRSTWEANTTIADFKAAFADELALQVPMKDEATQTPIILKGRVISSDASGNIYKSLVIQDETAAIAFSINKGSMYCDYRIGQEIVVKATGLWVGQYNNYLQFGMLGEYNGIPQITFMSINDFESHAQLNGLPDTEMQYVRYGKPWPSDSPYCTIINIEDIPTSGQPYLNIMSQLVEIPNVSFVDAGKDPVVTFAPYQDNADRYVKDAAGNQINVRCSGYSSFYNDPLPEGTGSVRGILSRYGDTWQLLLRGKDDVLFDTEGTRDNPYTITQALAMANNGRIGYVGGVIVGSLKTGVQNVTDIQDIIFNATDAELDNNLVIAPAADCRDLSKMMLVELPSGSKARKYLNLLDNADRIGQELVIQGAFAEWLGMPGVTDVADGLGAFYIVGHPIDEFAGMGSGTSEDPFKVAYIIATNEPLELVWIEAYITGFVSGSDFNAGAQFTLDNVNVNYSGNNVVIGDAIETASVATCIPVSLSGTFRTQFGLKANPDKMHQKVRILGNVGLTVFGVYGITSVSDMAVVEE